MRYLILVLGFLLYSCKSSQSKNNSYSEEEWVKAYKTHVFCSCLMNGYENDTIFKLIKKKDPIVVYSEISFEDLKKAYAIGKKTSDKIPEIVLPTEDEYGNFNQKKKFIMQTCLDYYTSKELDSISHGEYNKLTIN
ncbi:hypothetical protein [Flavobacterium alkalisoli]|uniref:hypothetical protein n=1 Tax=Flavobacterium alkalisoli TaxID=2602769 RepID=UPI003A947752